MKSLSEIETTSKRASKAIGFSWGVSEEVAKGIRLLELFGLPGIKNLNQYYKVINKKKFDNLSVINKNNKSNKSALCPIDFVPTCANSCIATNVNVCSSIRLFSSLFFFWC